MSPSQSLYSRLAPLPTGVPFGLRSAGRMDLAPGCRTSGWVTGFVHVVWSVAGTGWARIDGVDHIFPPQHTAAFPPPATHCLHATTEAWQYRWITLDGPGAAWLVSGLGLGATPVLSGPCPDAVFDELERAVLVIGPEGERRATVPAYRLLVEAACGRGQQAPRLQWTEWAESIRRLIAEHLGDSGVGIAQLAELAGLDRTTLTYRFKKAAGVSPKAYVTALRLQRAMVLLRTTDASVAMIAGQCGFSCANYFIKAFARRVGTTPLRYRLQAV